MLVFGFTFYGCEKDLIHPIATDHSDQIATLGERSPIPFTVENMQLAYRMLKANPTATSFPGENKETLSKSTTGYQITVTHNYYRFLPTSLEQLELLVSDDVLLVSDVPFEYDSDLGSENYMDPDLANAGAEFTYYYSVAPVDYVLPDGIAYETIGQLHFTPEDKISDTPTATEAQALDFFHDLNLEARQLSGDLDQTEEAELTYFETVTDAADPAKPSMRYEEVIAQGLSLQDVIIDFSDIETNKKRRRWTPSGRVTVDDDDLSRFNVSTIVGVRNAEIRVRKWGFVPLRTTETLFDGTFATRSTRTKNVRYAVHFHPNDNRFTVKAGTIFWDARHIGTKKYSRSEWMQHFSAGRGHFYSLIQNAAADFMFDWTQSSSFQVKSPRHGIDIVAEYNSSNSARFLPYVTGFPNPTPLFIAEIRIGRLRKNVAGPDLYRGSINIYGNTIHELTHASHFQLHRSLFVGVGGIVDAKQRDLMIESWALGVETIITNHRYQDRFNRNVRYRRSQQFQYVDQQNDADPLVIDEYTPLFIDLNDSFNQNILGGNPRPPVDRVSGYTIPQMQQSLNGSTTLVQLENSLRDIHNNPTENNVAELFEYVAEVLESIRNE